MIYNLEIYLIYKISNNHQLLINKLLILFITVVRVSDSGYCGYIYNLTCGITAYARKSGGMLASYRVAGSMLSQKYVRQPKKHTGHQTPNTKQVECFSFTLNR